MLTGRPRWSVVYIQVLYIVSSLSLGKGIKDLVFIVDQNVINEDSITKPSGVELTLGCGYTRLVTNVALYRVDGDQPIALHTTSGPFDHFRYSFISSYTERSTQGCKTYRCEGEASGGQTTVDLTIDFGGCPTGNSKKFTGLKPLIFTVASVILLGTLAIVAIITCWIRARRSFNSRQIRPNNTPQDYLDYINDNEFTPLTTSEFLASLQERPPTYNQSEEMVQSSAEGDNTASTSQTPQPPAAGAESRPPAPSSSREGAGSQAERGRGRPRRVRRDRSQNTTAAEGAGSEGGDPSNQQEGSEAGGQGEESGRQHPHGPAGKQDQHTSPHTDSSGDVDRTRVAILVDLESPVEGLGLNDTPTCEQIEEIEAQVRTLESLAPPRSSPRLPSPLPLPLPLLSADGTGPSEDSSTNLHVNPPPPLSPPAHL